MHPNGRLSGGNATVQLYISISLSYGGISHISASHQPPLFPQKGNSIDSVAVQLNANLLPLCRQPLLPGRSGDVANDISKFMASAVAFLSHLALKRDSNC